MYMNGMLAKGKQKIAFCDFRFRRVLRRARFFAYKAKNADPCLPKLHAQRRRSHRHPSIVLLQLFLQFLTAFNVIPDHFRNLPAVRLAQNFLRRLLDFFLQL